MKKTFFIFLLPTIAFAWDFTQERNTITVYFDSLACQVPWGTGYNYIAPTFVDINGDESFDLVVGSDWNRLSLFINQGNSDNYNFEFNTDTLVNVPTNQPQSQTPNRPEFADIDNDGDLDMFIGTYYSYPINEGNLLFYENIGNNANYNFILIEENYQGINCVWSETQPRFVDIDADGDYDLFLGFQTPGTGLAGKIKFYLNNGTPDSASMVLESEQFLGIDLGYYCIPAFCDIDNDGDYDMFLGDEEGHLHFYRNTSTPEVYNFVLESNNYFNIDVGFIASPTFCDIDADGDLDLFVGHLWNQVVFWDNIGTPDSARFVVNTMDFLNTPYQGGFCSICFGDLDNDGDLDLIRGHYDDISTPYTDAYLDFYRNEGTAFAPNMVLEEEHFAGIAVVNFAVPYLEDIYNDGDLDLFVGDACGGVSFWRNNEITCVENPSFSLSP